MQSTFFCFQRRVPTSRSAIVRHRGETSLPSDESPRFTRGRPASAGRPPSRPSVSSRATGDPTEPLTPRRLSALRALALPSVRPSALSSLPREGPRHPRTRMPSTHETPLGARPIRTAQSVPEPRCSSLEAAVMPLQLDDLTLVAFAVESSTTRLRSSASATQRTTRGHIRGFRPPTRFRATGSRAPKDPPVESRQMRNLRRLTSV